MTDDPNPATGSDMPEWQPVAALETLTAEISEELAELADHYLLLGEARPTCQTPRIVDDETIQTATRTYKEIGTEYREVRAEQGRRWRAGQLDAATEARVDAYLALVAQVHERIAMLLALTNELAEHTIERRISQVSDPGTGT